MAKKNHKRGKKTKSRSKPRPTSTPIPVVPGSADGLLSKAKVFLARWRAYLIALVASIGGVIAVHKTLGSPPWWMTVGVIAAPLLLVYVIESFPPLLEARRKKRLSQLQIVFKPGFFRLDPRPDTPEEYGQFNRADGLHKKVASWVLGASCPMLYLTGVSGCGKSSIIHAYLRPNLASHDVCCVVVRTFADPVSDLRRLLTEPNEIWERPPDLSAIDPYEMLQRASSHLRGLKKRLVLVFDQFEEVFILEGQQSGTVQSVRNLLARQLGAAVDGLTIILVSRFEYIGKFEQLGLPRLELWVNWGIVDAFSLPAGQAFLRQGNVPAQDAVGLSVQGSELDEIATQVRPVTLNMLGMIYEQDPATGAKLAERGVRRGLLLRHLKGRVTAGDLRETAPKLLRVMIAESGARQPPSRIGELAGSVQLTSEVVRGTLLRLQQDGLVRPVAGTYWEISHDFLAAQLNIVLGQIEGAYWRRVAPWVSATAALLILVLPVSLWIAGEIDHHERKAEFYKAGGEFAPHSRRVEFAGFNSEFPPKAVAYLRDLDPPPRLVFINCLRFPAESIQELAKTTSIEVLDLYGGVELNDDAVNDLANLPRLKSLSIIILSEDGGRTLEKYLPRFEKLENLQIGGWNATNSIINTISNMRALKVLGLRLHRLDEKGIEELQRRRPDLTIVVDNYHPLRGEDSKKDNKVILPTKSLK
jgi:hypothetical protein